MAQTPIVLPHNYIPREYQLPILSALDGGIKRAVAVWHRRSGKDKTLWNFMIKRAFERIGNYYYFFPTYAQAKKAIWLNKDKAGFPYLKHIPSSLLKGEPNNTEMLLQFINGSLIQMIGTENIDSVMSTNPVGCVFSEYALQDPSGWNFVRPILRENEGWAVFDYTPRGKNHGHDLYLMAKDNPEWYCDLLTIDETFGHGGTVGRAEVDSERRAGMSENLIQQEYFCLDPGTRVLTADLTWVPLHHLLDNPVDLVGIDEYPGPNGRRKLRRSRVLKTWETVKPCIEMTLSNGRVIKASMEHPWLVRKQRDKWHWSTDWVKTEKLIPGMMLVFSGLNPWETDQSRDGGYLAGLFDGEGSLARRSVSFGQQPGDILNTGVRLLRDKGFAPYICTSGTMKNVGLNMHDSIRFLGMIRPQRLLKKAERIWEGCFPTIAITPLEIIRIEEVQESPVIGISTNTETFIAEGVFTHNCSFEAAVEHAVFGQQLWLARNEKRICNVPWIKTLTVNTYWDIGWNDATSIWFEQTVHGEIHLIDHYETRQASLDHFIKVLRDKDYLYGTHFLPHDAEHKRMATGKSTQEVGWDLGFDTEIVPKLSEEDQINAGRMIFNRCWFDESKCAKGVDALSSYHFEWDDEKRILGATPKHDWSSHASKAFELMAVAHRDEIEYKRPDRYAKKQRSHRSFMAA